jgi:hypothetical protein
MVTTIWRRNIRIYCIFTLTQKLGGLTAVFLLFLIQKQNWWYLTIIILIDRVTGNRIEETEHANMISVARSLTYTAVPHDKDLSMFDEIFNK